MPTRMATATWRRWREKWGHGAWDSIPRRGGGGMELWAIEVPPGRRGGGVTTAAGSPLVDGLGRQQSRDASYRCTVGAQLQGGGDENQQSF